MVILSGHHLLEDRVSVMVEARKKSPRAPSMSLPEALERTMLVYNKEGKHTVASAVVAQDIGYKDATNGAALSALAAIKYYGLLTSPSRGQLAVSEDVEEYKYSTNPKTKRELLIKWLKYPKIYSTLLEAFPDRLPSDAAIKYELIKMGFVDKAANSCLKQFKASIEFSGYYDTSCAEEAWADQHLEAEVHAKEAQPQSAVNSGAAVSAANEKFDRIPVRLAGGRKAWLEVPVPFYEKDKEMIKKYVDIIVVDEDE